MNIEKLKNIDIEQEKVLRIAKSGFKVFACNDFEKASTNLIVEDAGVSRGILYHYFAGKQELFEFLLYFSAKKLLDNMTRAVDWNHSDYFLRLRQSVASKLRTTMEFPYLYEFGTKYKKSYPKSIYEDLAPGVLHCFYHENLDFSKVRKEVDLEMMKQTVQYTLGEVARKEFDRLFKQADDIDSEDLLAQAMMEIDAYLAFFRTTFYEL